jgi:hypothetical protein
MLVPRLCLVDRWRTDQGRVVLPTHGQALFPVLISARSEGRPV